jgi:hypothetical protein
MNPIHKRLDADFERVMREEARDGICCDDDVCLEDREPPTTVGIFDAIPQPITPRSKYDEATASTTHDEE